MKTSDEISRRHRQRAAAVATALSVIAFTACDATEEDRRDLQHGFALYAQRQVDESEAVATKFINANPAVSDVDEAYYLRGISRLTRGGAENRRNAAADLHLALEKTQRADLKAKAYRALGDISYDALQWSDARDMYEKALAAASVPPSSAAVLNYRIGACLQAVGNWSQSSAWFQRVISDKDPLLNERAIARMRSTAFALQFGAFQERPNAYTLRDQLTNAGVAAQVDTEFRDGVLIYLVRYGSFHTYPEAETARDRFISRYPVVAIIP